MTVRDVRIDHIALERFVRNPQGGPVRDLRRRTRNVTVLARQIAPAKTGRLARSIEGNVEFGTFGPVGRVGSDLRYALYAHEPTRPHIIRPVRTTYLRFQGRSGIVSARYVWHPGTSGRPYLTRALPAARM